MDGGGGVSLKSAPYYWVVCDDCGRSAQENADVSAWLQEDVAVDEAVSAGWWVASEHEDAEDKDYCDGCGIKHGLDYCDGCGDLQRVERQENTRLCAECRDEDRQEESRG
jgi:hypothetical protein